MDHSVVKDKIIREIKRIASDNGGQAPGRRQFSQETGIAESEWFGKIWPRWSDAIVEAGLPPNEKQGRFDTDYVLLRYAEVCRHYGRPPTNAELRMYARTTDGFPSHNTFGKHFTGKSDLIEALTLWAHQNGEDGLVSLLPKVSTQNSKNVEISNDTNKPDGYVYLLKSGSHYKIGRSDEIEKRIKQITISLPEKVELVHVIRTDDPPGIEAYWHRRFAERRANGEWFLLSPPDVKVFKKRKFQ